MGASEQAGWELGSSGEKGEKDLVLLARSAGAGLLPVTPTTSESRAEFKEQNTVNFGGSRCALSPGLVKLGTKDITMLNWGNGNLNPRFSEQLLCDSVLFIEPIVVAPLLSSNSPVSFG